MKKILSIIVTACLILSNVENLNISADDVEYTENTETIETTETTTTITTTAITTTPTISTTTVTTTPDTINTSTTATTPFDTTTSTIEINTINGIVEAFYPETNYLSIMYIDEFGDTEYKSFFISDTNDENLVVGAEIEIVYYTNSDDYHYVISYTIESTNAPSLTTITTTEEEPSDPSIDGNDTITTSISSNSGDAPPIQTTTTTIITTTTAIPTYTHSVTTTTPLQELNDTLNIILMLDTSASMENQPIEIMKQASIEFCEKILSSKNNVKIAVISYNNSSTIGVNFTDDINSIKNYINTLFANGSTNMSDALMDVKFLLENTTAYDKSIVIVADGTPNVGGKSPTGDYSINDNYNYEYANYCLNYNNFNIKNLAEVYSIGFFHDNSSNDNFSQDFMKNLAGDSSNYINTDIYSLSDAFNSIADEILYDIPITMTVSNNVVSSVYYPPNNSNNTINANTIKISNRVTTQKSNTNDNKITTTIKPVSSPNTSDNSILPILSIFGISLLATIITRKNIR